MTDATIIWKSLTVERWWDIYLIRVGASTGLNNSSMYTSTWIFMSTSTSKEYFTTDEASNTSQINHNHYAKYSQSTPRVVANTSQLQVMSTLWETGTRAPMSTSREYFCPNPLHSTKKEYDAVDFALTADCETNMTHRPMENMICLKMTRIYGGHLHR